jgi:hypothetical protein
MTLSQHDHMRYDYVVVGAGFAGATLAARLSADPGSRSSCNPIPCGIATLRSSPCIAGLTSRRAEPRGKNPMCTCGAGGWAGTWRSIPRRLSGAFGKTLIFGSNVFEGVPTGGDAHVLSAVVSSWEDERPL